MAIVNAMAYHSEAQKLHHVLGRYGMFIQREVRDPERNVSYLTVWHMSQSDVAHTVTVPWPLLNTDSLEVQLQMKGFQPC